MLATNKSSSIVYKSKVNYNNGFRKTINQYGETRITYVGEHHMANRLSQWPAENANLVVEENCKQVLGDQFATVLRIAH